MILLPMNPFPPRFPNQASSNLQGMTCRPIKSRLRSPPVTGAESGGIGDSSDSDPLAVFAQQIRGRIDASGLSESRLGLYIPSLVHRLVEYRISVLVSGLLS